MLLRRTSQREADVLSSSSPAEKSKGKELKSRGRRIETEKKNLYECSTEGREGDRLGGELDGCGGEEGASLGPHARHSLIMVFLQSVY